MSYDKENRVYITYAKIITYTRLFILVFTLISVLLLDYCISIKCTRRTAKLNTNKSQLSLIAKFPHIK